jgi:high-affinity iron transporter
MRLFLLLAWASCLLFAPAAPAAAADAPSPAAQAQTVIHLLDYVGVDYPEFVRDGRVLDAAEYAEQREFASQAIALLRQLPAAPAQPAVLERARQLLARIDAKAPGDEVSALAGSLRADVIRTWRVAVAPRQLPDLQRAAALYQARCASCHGAQGRGDGPLAKGLDPAPSDFHDAARMQQRSLYGLYNTITLGVNGTSMRGFGELPESDRWALAFFAGGLRAEPAELERGRAAWAAGTGRAAFPGLRELVMTPPAEAAARDAALGPVQAWLTREPQALAAAQPSPLAFARARLQEAVEASRQGAHETARQAAISAYLEGFELLEAALDNVDGPLRQRTEREMMALRAAIAERQPPETVAAIAARIEELLERAEERLSGGGLSPMTAFVSALVILLREGLEAILVLSAISAFIARTGRRDAMPYVHAGWIGALALGLVTWGAATTLVTVSGANRELTEGVTALLAAAMLLYVGWWMHAKSTAAAWQGFIRDQVNAALGRRTLWAMAGVSFLAVYRELFEIILFYQTLWAQAGPGSRDALLAGIGVAALLLALVGGLLLRYSRRLPIGPFFRVTSLLLVVLAVVFVGNGIAALQEAGMVAATLLAWPEVPLLGVHPTVQGLAWQAVALVLVAVGLAVNRRRSVAARSGSAAAGR